MGFCEKKGAEESGGGGKEVVVVERVIEGDELIGAMGVLQDGSDNDGDEGRVNCAIGRGALEDGELRQWRRVSRQRRR